MDSLQLAATSIMLISRNLRVRSNDDVEIRSVLIIQGKHSNIAFIVPHLVIEL